MAKIYAVKFADESHKMFDNWTDCEKAVKNKVGVKYKSFAKLEDAKAWISGKTIEKPGLRVYVDGSFMPPNKFATWSWVAVEDGVEIASDFGTTPEPALSRNIDGEVFAAWHAMEFLAKIKRKGTICHDYQGIASWATGEWKANSAVATVYLSRISEIKIWANFEKVSGHSGDKWNDLADSLAKKAFKNAKNKTAK
ncbi:double-stranded DNA-binding protein [Fibrobacterales bacterium]|nr:double-stranded DNA-binding protein [Fibrobacterales bacterium]